MKCSECSHYETSNCGKWCENHKCYNMPDDLAQEIEKADKIRTGILALMVVVVTILLAIMMTR